MFGIGMPELIIILVIALIVIGPRKLPDLAKALGKGMSEFRKATQEIKESLDVEAEFKEAKEDLVDSITGLDAPPEPEPLASDAEAAPKYDNFDDMMKDYEKSKDHGEEEEKGEDKKDEASDKEKGRNG